MSTNSLKAPCVGFISVDPRHLGGDYEYTTPEALWSPNTQADAREDERETVARAQPCHKRAAHPNANACILLISNYPTSGSLTAVADCFENIAPLREAPVREGALVRVCFMQPQAVASALGWFQNGLGVIAGAAVTVKPLANL